MGAYQTCSLKKKIDEICESNWKDSILISSLIVNKKSLVSSFKLQSSLPPSLTLISLLVFKGSWGFDLPHACVDRHLQSICSSCLVGARAAAAVKCMDICILLVYIVLMCCWSQQPPIYRHHQYPPVEASGLTDFFEGRVLCWLTREVHNLVTTC
jgi:hypothetical protein